MIRLGIRIRDDIRTALFKVRKSDEYNDFLNIVLELRLKHKFSITTKDTYLFQKAEMKVMSKVKDLTWLILMRCISQHKSKRKSGSYRKSAIKGAERFVRVLKYNAGQILPDYYPSLEYKLDEMLSDFRQERVL